MPKFLLRALIAIVSIVLVLGVIELVLRLSGFVYPPVEPIQIWNRLEDKDMRLGKSLHVESPEQLWVPNAGAEIPPAWAKDERVNEAGYRGPVLSLAKKPGVLRIATLGDSSTFGYAVGYADTYSAQLEKLLNENGVKAEVLDGGVIGFTVRQGLERYRKLIRDYKPDVVIEAFGAVNDHLPALQGIADNQKIRMHVELGGYWTQIGITLRSELRIAHWMAKFSDDAHPERRKARDDAFIAERERAKIENQMGKVDWKGLRRVPLVDFEACLMELKSAVEADGARLILISMPRQPMIEKQEPVLLEYSKKVLEIGEREKLDVVDGRALFAAELAKGKTVQDLFKDAYHPAPLGHSLLAHELFAKLANGAKTPAH